VLFTVVKHVATLAKGLQVSQPVVGWIMIEVRSRESYPGCENCDVVASASNKAASASIAPSPFVLIPPSTVA
jgi:hypothetical protein